MYERISIDPKVCHGQACIKGTRIPVHQIVRMMANGDTIEDLLKEYPVNYRSVYHKFYNYRNILTYENYLFIGR
jgi:uncharacterized protein (DUF433 family)